MGLGGAGNKRCNGRGSVPLRIADFQEVLGEPTVALTKLRDLCFSGEPSRGGVGTGPGLGEEGAGHGPRPLALPPAGLGAPEGAEAGCQAPGRPRAEGRLSYRRVLPA